MSGSLISVSCKAPSLGGNVQGVDDYPEYLKYGEFSGVLLIYLRSVKGTGRLPRKIRRATFLPALLFLEELFVSESERASAGASGWVQGPREGNPGGRPPEPGAPRAALTSPRSPSPRFSERQRAKAHALEGPEPEDLRPEREARARSPT